MKLPSCAALALSLVATGAAHAAAPFPVPPKAGVSGYTYEVTETVNGRFQHGYRMVFDLETANGTTDVIVRSAEETADGKTWEAAKADDACKQAMRAPPGGVARARLLPMSADLAKGLGADFLATCAPPAVFFPLTDILNVVVIPSAPRFRASALKRQGDSVHYNGFDASFDRTGETFKEISHGGEVSLPVLADGKAVIDWAPANADLDLTETANGQPVHLVGTEHFAFRVTLDSRTGALIEAHTTYDDLDLKAHMPGMPEGATAPVKITRAVAIAPR